MKRYIKSNFDTTDSQLKKELEEAGYAYMQSQGFTEDEAKDWFIVEIKNSETSEGPEKRVEVRAELSFDEMFELSEVLDPIIQKYDPDSYFDMVTSGIMEAVLYNPEYRAKEKVELNSIDDYYDTAETLKDFIENNLVGSFVSDDDLSGNIELEMGRSYSRGDGSYIKYRIIITYNAKDNVESSSITDLIYYFYGADETEPFTYKNGETKEIINFATIEEVIDFLKSEFDL